MALCLTIISTVGLTCLMTGLDLFDDIVFDVFDVFDDYVLFDDYV